MVNTLIEKLYIYTRKRHPYNTPDDSIQTAETNNNSYPRLRTYYNHKKRDHYKNVPMTRNSNEERLYGMMAVQRPRKQSARLEEERGQRTRSSKGLGQNVYTDLI